ncbi:MAG: hypothetical protein ACXQS6_00975 [Candidatus Syntropharchaeales archaeon]
MGGKKGIKVLEEVFKKGGYRVEDSLDYDFDLIAKQDGKRVLIILKETLKNGETDYYSNIAEEVDGRILIVVTGEIEDRTRANSDKLIIWDRERFSREIGMAVIANIEGSDFLIDLGDVKPDTIPTFPIKLDKKKALKIADKNFRAVISIQLKYIPIWSFTYAFRSILHSSQRPVELEGRGRVLFNGITGRRLETGIPEHAVDLLPESEAMVEPVEVDASSLSEIVIEQVVEENAKIVSFDKTSTDSIISEQWVFKPKQEDIEIESHLIYLPIWEIEGDKGFMQLDAASGEEIIDPMDDGVEIF